MFSPIFLPKMKETKPPITTLAPPSSKRKRKVFKPKPVYSAKPKSSTNG